MGKEGKQRLLGNCGNFRFRFASTCLKIADDSLKSHPFLEYSRRGREYIYIHIAVQLLLSIFTNENRFVKYDCICPVIHLKDDMSLRGFIYATSSRFTVILHPYPLTSSQVIKISFRPNAWSSLSRCFTIGGCAFGPQLISLRIQTQGPHHAIDIWSRRKRSTR